MGDGDVVHEDARREEDASGASERLSSGGVEIE
jgi:hypothetical protein